ncbi:ChrR family anti-sigma-E factor [Amorphus sp. 3PC139-8]|uniref:ChrR family anti-sigma-E factor n=1 Tax=Amorphus sp. 3PC139-8 TaxID=2735676 RepID=UPI00345C8EEB
MIDENAASHGALDTLLAEYVAGGLPQPVEVMVAAHIELNEVSRRFASDLERAAGVVLDRLEPVAVADRDHNLDSIFALDADLKPDVGFRSLVEGAALPSASGLPRAIERYAGRPLSDVPWRRRLPGIQQWRIGTEEGYEASLVRLRPGCGLPPHTHNGTEMTLVLQGGFSDSLGHYGVGDISIADDEIDHQPIADDDGDCIGFVVSNASLHLTGWIGRLLAPFRPR